jgi:hypothetical protein
MDKHHALLIWLTAAPKDLQSGPLPLEIDASISDEALLTALLPHGETTLTISEHARPPQALVSREATVCGIRVTLRHCRPATREDVQAAAEAKLRLFDRAGV